jgi:hypothetical protein
MARPGLKGAWSVEGHVMLTSIAADAPSGEKSASKAVDTKTFTIDSM